MQKAIIDIKEIFYEIGTSDDMDKYLLLQALAQEAFETNLLIKKEGFKPYVSNHTDLHCSLSDSGDVTFVALCKGCHIGVDVERIQQRKSEMLAYCCTEEELLLFHKKGSLITDVATAVWSLKESVQKSDVTIASLHEYVVTDISNNKVAIQREKCSWQGLFFERGGYFFSIVVRII